MKRKTIMLLASLMVVTAMWANGDPTVSYCALTLSKAPVSRHIPEVQIVDEKIVFEPRDRCTHVHVTYKLRNKSDKTFKDIAYGFPIDWEGKGRLHWKESEYFEDIMQIGWSDDYVRDFSMTINGKRLECRCSGDTLVQKAVSLGEERARFRKLSQQEKDSLEKNEDVRFYLVTDSQFTDDYIYKEPIYRKWYYSCFSIGARETVTLVVDYTVQNNHSIGMAEVNKEFRKYYDYGCQEVMKAWNYILYDFTPAAAWGNGRADRFSFRIESKDTLKSDDYKLKDNQFKAENFDFATAKDLRIYHCFELPAEQDAESLTNHRLSGGRYHITVNGKEGNYEALCDNDLTSAMTLPADENGMVYIKITTASPEFVTGLAIAHGDWMNPRAYAKSVKADSMRIVCLYRNEGSWHRFYYGRYVDSFKADHLLFVKNVFEKPDFSSRKTLLLSTQRFNILGRYNGLTTFYNAPWGPDDYMVSLTIQLHAPEGKGVTLSEIILTEDTKGWSDYYKKLIDSL